MRAQFFINSGTKYCSIKLFHIQHPRHCVARFCATSNLQVVCPPGTQDMKFSIVESDNSPWINTESRSGMRESWMCTTISCVYLPPNDNAGETMARKIIMTSRREKFAKWKKKKNSPRKCERRILFRNIKKISWNEAIFLVLVKRLQHVLEVNVHVVGILANIAKFPNWIVRPKVFPRNFCNFYQAWREKPRSFTSRWKCQARFLGGRKHKNLR